MPRREQGSTSQRLEAKIARRRAHPLVRCISVKHFRPDAVLERAMDALLPPELQERGNAGR